MRINIFDTQAGEGLPTYVIAEIGLNHNGSVEIAEQLIDKAIWAGCNAVKFQKRDVPSLAVKSFLDAEDTRFPEFGKTYGEIRNFVELTEQQLIHLKEYSARKGIDYFITPFDLVSLASVQRINVPVLKSASHNLTFMPLIQAMAATRKPLIISTGMSTLEEVDRTVALLKKEQVEFALLHCVSAYPTPVNLVNLKAIDFLRERYSVPVGYSGHEEAQFGFLPTLAAVARGACLIERHITLDNSMIGFDHKISLNPQDLKSLVDQIRTLDRMMGSGEKKLLTEENVKRLQQRVSIASAREIHAGTAITESMLCYKGPGTGFASYEIGSILGKKAMQDIPADTVILPTMLS